MIYIQSGSGLGIFGLGVLFGEVAVFGRALCRHRHMIFRRNPAGHYGTRVLSVWHMVATKGAVLSADEQAGQECWSSHPVLWNWTFLALAHEVKIRLTSTNSPVFLRR